MIKDYELVSIKNIQSKSSIKKIDCEVEALNTFLAGYAPKKQFQNDVFPP